jgi:hypothetical protein
MKQALALATLAAILASSRLPTLKCTIALGRDGDVHVVVENTSPAPITADVHVTLGMESGQGAEIAYWAPVDLGTSRPYGANEPRHMNLVPGGAIKAHLTPTSLLWERSISSVWPNKKLGEAVPKGRYTLHLEVELPAPAPILKSNPLAVVVDGNDSKVLAQHP